MHVVSSGSTAGLTAFIDQQSRQTNCSSSFLQQWTRQQYHMAVGVGCNHCTCLCCKRGAAALSICKNALAVHAGGCDAV